ncbi:MAG: HAD family hydrolase [bacterium]
MFDFDGVLVNTLDGSYNIHTELNPDLSRERFDSWANGNFHEGLQKELDAGYVVPENFGEKYNANLVTMSIQEILRESVRFLSQKIYLAIVSSTPSRYIDAFLAKEGVRECFSDIMGADIAKSKVVKIKKLLEMHAIMPENTVFITDTLGDMREASDCGVPSIGVLWGQHGRESLEKGDPAAIIEDPRELIGAVESVLQ